MVLPRNSETVTRRILEISQYRSPLASVLAVDVSPSLTTLVFLVLESTPSLAPAASDARFREAILSVRRERGSRGEGQIEAETDQKSTLGVPCIWYTSEDQINLYREAKNQKAKQTQMDGFLPKDVSS